MIASDSNFYLSYLNKLVDLYHNTYHYSIAKNLLMLVNPKIGQEKYLLSILFWKLMLGHIKWKI